MRSHTSPELSLNTSVSTPPASKARESKVLAAEESESPSTEICQSPSWSDHGEEKRRKEKKKKIDKMHKEQMEVEKRQKREEDNQKNSAAKAGKRLSKKPPPAAMDTQRMPTALRRTMTNFSISPQTSSDDSHRSWKDDRRSSLTSIVSFMGFSKPSSRRNSLSQPPSPTMSHQGASPIISQAEKSPDLVNIPSRESPNTYRSESSDSDKLYDKDIVEFAYQLDASTKLAQMHDSKPVKQVRISSPLQIPPSEPLPSNRSAKDTSSPGKSQDTLTEKKPLRPILVNRDSCDGAAVRRLDEDQKNSSPNQEPIKSLDKKVTVKSTAVDDLAQYLGVKSAVTTSKNASNTPSPRGRQSYDGNSYVHKQRMYQQQRSIAGYEDELAVLGANETFERMRNQVNQHQIWPPTPQDSAESLNHDGVLFNQRKAEGIENKHIQRDTSSLSQAALRQSTAENESHDPKNDYQLSNGQAKSNSEPMSKNGRNLENTESPSSVKGEHSRTEAKSSQLHPDLQPRRIYSGSTDTSVPPINQKHSQSKTDPANSDSPSEPLSDRKLEKRELTKISQGEKGSLSKKVVIEGVDGDGLVRKTSLKRPRSDPQLQVSANVPKLPSLDFLPELKHQPLTKPKRTSHLRTSTGGTFSEVITPVSSSQFPVPSSTFSQSTSARASDPPSMVKVPFAPSRPRAESPSKPPAVRSSSSNPSQMQLHPSHPIPATDSSLASKPIAKMFVICCKCKYWHDLPSRLYEAMALPRKIQSGDKIAQSVGAKTGGERKGKKIEGKVFTTVNCPWCAHGMSTACCAGWTTVVYLHERHH